MDIFHLLVAAGGELTVRLPFLSREGDFWLVRLVVPTPPTVALLLLMLGPLFLPAMEEDEGDSEEEDGKAVPLISAPSGVLLSWVVVKQGP